MNNAKLDGVAQFFYSFSGCACVWARPCPRLLLIRVYAVGDGETGTFFDRFKTEEFEGTFRYLPHAEA